MLCAHTAGRLCSRKFGIINVWIRVLKWPRLFDFSSSASSSVVMGSGGGLSKGRDCALFLVLI